jgi:hypothetical protein
VTGTSVRLLLDEMFSPTIAEELRRRGHDVIALAADAELRALSDPEVYTWAGDQGRRVVTENVKDFRALASSPGGPGVLFTSSRSFPRSRRNLGPLVHALDRWLVGAATTPRPLEDWLLPVADD